MIDVGQGSSSIGAREWSGWFRESSGTAPALRVGIVIDGFVLPVAAAEIVDDVVASTFAELSGVMVLPAGARPHPGARSLRLFRSWDRRRIGSAVDASARMDRTSVLAQLPELRRSGRGPGSEDPGGLELDVLLHLSAGRVDRDLAWSARHGLWWLDLGGRSLGDADMYFREMAVDSPTIDATLIRRSGDGPDQVLACASFAAEPGSIEVDQRRACFGAPVLVIQTLRDLHAGGAERLGGRTPCGPVVPATVAGGPSEREVVKWIGRKAIAKARRRLDRTQVVQQWRIGIRQDGPENDPRQPTDLTGFRWVETPLDRYYADPFLWEHEGRSWLFLEDYRRETAKGVIGCVEVVDGAPVGAPSTVLTAPGHLSYPYVFSDGDATYMVPESGADGEVSLYRASRFPHEWQRITTLYPGPAMDTSVFHDGETWWFFTTVREPRGGATMLLLFFADVVGGPWVPHPDNPVSMDVRNARGAGRIFEHGGRLIRPSQDCSRTYGYAVTFFEVVTLTRTRYEERPVGLIRPDADPRLEAIHTFNRLRNLEVIDGRSTDSVPGARR